MQHHINTLADPTASISLEDVPHLYGGRRATVRLNVVVVGAGIGGLAAAHTLAHAGHHVTVLESTRELRDAGAGIQITPNATRLLLRWGLGPALEACAVEPAAIVFRRYDTGNCVGRTSWGERMKHDHGARCYHIHRADYQAMLLRLARAAPDVETFFGSAVSDVQPDPQVAGGPSVTLASGKVLYADLIVGADGVRSTVRKALTGPEDMPRPTGDTAYCAILNTDRMLEDPELRPFVNNPEMAVWMAPRRHLMACCIRAKEYNLALFCRDDGSVEQRTEQSNADRMRDDFSDFEPRVGKLLSFVQSTPKRRLLDHEPLATWFHPKGRLVLLGDACHPMLPYRGQGGAIAIEDAAVLGALLSHVKSLEQLPDLLQAYEDLRLPRATATQDSSRLNQGIFHLPDGREQRARDKAMRAAMKAEREGKPIQDGNQNQWADQTKNHALFDYDAYAEVEQWWNDGGCQLIEAFARGGQEQHAQDDAIRAAVEDEAMDVVTEDDTMRAVTEDDAIHAAMEHEREGKPIQDENPASQWADQTKNHALFDHDTYAEVERWWNDGGLQDIEELVRGGPSLPLPPPWPLFSTKWSFKPTLLMPTLALSAVLIAAFVI